MRLTAGFVASMCVACSAPPAPDMPTDPGSASASVDAPPVAPPVVWSKQTLDYQPSGELLQLIPTKQGGPRVAFATTGKSSTLFLTRAADDSWTAEDYGTGTGTELGALVAGNLIAVGREGGVYAFAPPGGGPPKLLDEGPELLFSLDASQLEGGAPHVCWTGGKGKKLTTKYATLSASQWIVKDIPVADAALCSIVASSDGTAVLAITTQDDLLRLIEVDARAEMGTPIDGGKGRWPGLARSPDGALTVAVTREDGFYVGREEGKLTAPPTLVKISGKTSYHPSIAFDKEGKLHIARVLYSSDPSSNDRVQVDASSPAGAAPWTAHDLGPSSGRRTDLLVDDTGRTWVLFVARDEAPGNRLVLATDGPAPCKSEGSWCTLDADVRVSASACAASLIVPPPTETLESAVTRHCKVAADHFDELSGPLSDRCNREDVAACTLLGVLHTAKSGLGYVELKVLRPRACADKKSCKRFYQAVTDESESGFAGALVDPARARPALARACHAGGAYACEILSFAEEKDKPADALVHATSACAGGRPVACASGIRLAQNADKLESSSELLRVAHATLTLACQSDDPASCVNLGFLLEGGLGAKKDVNKAAAAYRLACELEDGHGCERILALKSSAAAALAGVDWKEVATLLETSCGVDDPSLCLAFTDALDRGVGVKRDAARAKKIRADTCAAHPGVCAD